MLMTKHKPVSVGEILMEEFIAPMGLTQAALANAMGVQRKHVNELCNNRRKVTAATALNPFASVRQHAGLLAKCAATQRPLGGAAQPARTQADRAGQALEGSGMTTANSTRVAAQFTYLQELLEITTVILISRW